MIKNLTSNFANNASFLVQNDFTLIKSIKKFVDSNVSPKHPLIISNLDEDQIWAQLKNILDESTQKIQKQLKQFEIQADKLAIEEEKQFQNEVDEEKEEEQLEDDDDKANIEQLEDNEEEENLQQIKQGKSKKLRGRQPMKSDMEQIVELEKYLDDIDQGKRQLEEDDDDEEQDGEDAQKNDENNEENEFENEGEDSVFEDMRELDIIENEKEDEEVKQLEQEIIAKKDWQMQGEVNARQRPLNSLIDENLDFQGTNTKLVIEQIGTEEYQKTLEDFIRKRVQDELFDDRQKVQFSQFLQETFANKKQSQEVDTNKNQFGLAELYERQFKNALGISINTSDQKLKSELLAEFKELCYKLDQLSNLRLNKYNTIYDRFEPKGFVRQGDIKVLTNNEQGGLALNKEEKVPLTYVKNTEQAPPPIEKEKKFNTFLTQAEALPSDRQRTRREVKRKLRNKLQDKKRKGLIKQLETKGQTKFMYNQAKKGQKMLSTLGSKIKNQESVKFDKTSNFFKNLQNAEVKKKIKK